MPHQHSPQTVSVNLLFLICTELLLTGMTTAIHRKDDDILSDVVPSNIVSRQVRLISPKEPQVIHFQSA
jgi:hypothetical protein